MRRNAVPRSRLIAGRTLLQFLAALLCGLFCCSGVLHATNPNPDDDEDECKDCGCAGASSAAYDLSLGKVTYVSKGRSKTRDFHFGIYEASINGNSYNRPTLKYVKEGRKGGKVLGDGGSVSDTALVRQVLTDEMLADIQPLPSGTLGYVLKLYPKSQVGALSGGLYTFSGSPVKTVTFRNPDGTALNGRFEVYLQESINGSSNAQTFRWRETRSGSSNVAWVFEQFQGEAPASGGTPVRRETLQRTELGGPFREYTQSRVEEHRGSSGALIVVAHKQERWAYYSGEKPVQLEETLDPNGPAPRTTTWAYYTESGDAVTFGKVKSLRRFDGYWEEISYTKSSAGFLTTKTMSSWLNSAAGVEAQAKVVTEVEDEQNKSLFSREEKIAGVVVASESTQRQSSGEGTTETRTVQTGGAGPLVTTTLLYSESDADLARAGRVRSVAHPDGTVETYTYSLDAQGALTTTHSAGAGSASGGVADGVRTVTKTTAAGYVLEETQTDIASGLMLGSKVAVPGNLDQLGRPQKFIYNNDPADYSEEQYGCCDVELRRDRDGKQTTYFYDELKRIKRTVSGYPGQPQETVEMVYDGLTTTVTRSVGAESVLVSRTTKNLIEETASEQAPDADGNNDPEITQYSYETLSGGGRKVTRTNPDWSTEITETYADGQTSKVYGTAVADTAYEYGTWAGGLWTKTIRLSGSGGTEEWGITYSDKANRLIKEEKAPGGAAYTTENTYNAGGQLVKTAGPDDATVLYGYNAKGEQNRQAIDMNRNGQIDLAGPDRVTDTTSSIVNDATLGICRKVVTQLYAQQGNATATIATTIFAAINGRGQRSESFGQTIRSVRSTPASGSWTVTITQPGNVQQVEEYTNGRLWRTTVKNSGGQQVAQVTLDYTPLGRLKSSTDSRIGATAFEYYANGQLRRQVSPHNSDTTIYTRDALGRVTDTELPDHSHQSQSYTLGGQVEWSTGSQTYPTRTLYDEQGRMSELHTFKDGTNNAPQVTRWHYDPVTGLLARKEYADNKGPGYTFTPGGRLLTRTWARKVNGQPLVTTYGYNDAGELSTIDYSDSTPDASFTYTRLGQPLQSANAPCTIDYGYDPATLRLTSETIASGPLSRTLSRGYDSLGRPGNITLLSGTTTEHRVGYGYDTAGRMQTVTRGSGAGAKTFTYGYVPNSAGLIATVTGPVHAVTNTWEPNRDVLQTKENKLNSNNTVISRFDYTVNALGQRKDISYSGSAFGASSFNLYGYDALGQVTSGQRYNAGTLASPQNPVSGQQFGYDYDLIGNRKSSTDGTTSSTYTPNALNQYEAINAATLTYDDDGNLLFDGTQSYQWDAENRLIKVTRGSVEVTSAYDAQSRRVRKTVHTGGALTGERAFLYDGWNMVAEYDLPASGAPLLHAANTWGLDLIGSLQGGGGVGGLLERVTTGSGGSTAGAYSFTFDANGNVSELLDQSGNIAAHYEYGPFGEPLRIIGGVASENPLRFSTKYTDSETEMLYYGYRYYRLQAGNWVSRDIVEEEGGANLYGFVRNAPVGETDFLGLTVRYWGASIVFNESSYAVVVSGDIARFDFNSPKTGATVITRYPKTSSRHSYWDNTFQNEGPVSRLLVKVYSEPKISNTLPAGSDTDSNTDETTPSVIDVDEILSSSAPGGAFTDKCCKKPVKFPLTTSGRQGRNVTIKNCKKVRNAHWFDL